MGISPRYIHVYIERNFNSLNFAILSQTEVIELIFTSCELMYNYIEEHILDYVYCDKFDDMFERIHELYSIQLDDFIQRQSSNKVLKSQEIDNSFRDHLNSDIMNILHITNRLIRKFVVPPREYPCSFIRIEQTLSMKARINAKIEHLKNIPQPAQRTREWYKFRHDTLTASSIWKIFGTESTQNQLIYSKCQPLEIRDSDCIDTEYENCLEKILDINSNSSSNIEQQSIPAPVQRININTPFHWGHKYEPLSVLYYEYQYSTKIDDFGCIPHQKYSYIAASPDGINCCPNSDRFGRMLEIKNIVNRDITGHPKMEYWVQMQLQMETCGLNECDFLETRFTEYSSQLEYLEDEQPTRFVNPANDANHPNPTNPQLKGLILHFEKNGQPIYKYHQFGLTEEEKREWEEKTMFNNPDLMWIRTIYWKLAEISCVLVLRNIMWFSQAQPFIELTNQIIQREKTGDYSHRAPKRTQSTKRQKKDIDEAQNQDMIIGTGKCHIVI